MLPSENCYNIIKKFEGCRLQAYKCPAGVWTIGYGATFYEDGTKVKEGDKVTINTASKILEYHVRMFAKKVELHVKVPINQNQFDALVSFAFNVGVGAFMGSTMLKKINVNPNTPNIRNEFMRWVKANGKVLKGLQIRRAAEADLYFNPIP